MNHLYLDAGVIGAIGLSITFVGIILSLVTLGIIFLIHRISEEKRKGFFEMVGLISAWAIFLGLNSQSSAYIGYTPLFLVYSLEHLISIFIGTMTIMGFGFMFSKLKKVFDKKLLMIAGGFAILSILCRIIFPFFGNTYLSLLQRMIIIVPPFLGFFMIIKSAINKNG